MVSFPDACPKCHAKNIAYSVGVLRNQLGASPVVWCEQCRKAYFTRAHGFPDAPWYCCQVNKCLMGFDKDPSKIDCNLLLTCDSKLVANVHIWSVSPVSSD
jgi:hypothetical protein